MLKCLEKTMALIFRDRRRDGLPNDKYGMQKAVVEKLDKKNDFFGPLGEWSVPPVEKEVVLPPYDPARSCVKCGRHESIYGYPATKRYVSDFTGEYILKTCIGCRYEWKEACRNTKEVEK